MTVNVNKETSLKKMLAWVVLISAFILLVLFLLSPSTVVDTKRQKAMMQCKTLLHLTEVYKSKFGRYPSEQEGIASILKVYPQKERKSFYRLLRDPWGNTMNFSVDLKRHIIMVYSFGEDGIDNKGYNDDIKAEKSI